MRKTHTFRSRKDYKAKFAGYFINRCSKNVFKLLLATKSVAFTRLFIPTSEEDQLQAGVRTPQAELEPYVFESAASSDLETAATVAASCCGFAFRPSGAKDSLPEKLQVSDAARCIRHLCIHVFVLINKVGI